MKRTLIVDLICWTEETYSPAIADAMISLSAMANDSPCVMMGSCDCASDKAMAMLNTLADMLGCTVDSLSESYANWLVASSAVLLPEWLEGDGNAQGFLRDVAGHMNSGGRNSADNAVHGLQQRAITHFCPDLDVSYDAAIDGLSEVIALPRPVRRSVGSWPRLNSASMPSLISA